MRYMRLAAALGCAVLLASCSTSSSSSSTSTVVGVAGAHPVHDVAVLSAVSCPTATRCVAVGATSIDGTGVVVPITNGKPGSVLPVTGSKGLDAVSCPTVTFCEAVGAGAGDGITVALSNGSLGKPLPVAGTTALSGISCPIGPICEATGRSATQGVVLTLTSPTDALPVTPLVGTTSVNGIDCASNTVCEVVASTSNGSINDVVATIASGIPGTIRVVPPGTSTFAGIACPSTVTCLAVGNGVHLVDGRNIPRGVVVSTVNGVPGKLTGLTGTPTTHFEAVSCGGPNHCVGVGTNGLITNGLSAGRGVFVTITNGVPGQPETVPAAKFQLAGVSCPTSSSCVAVGTDGTAQVLTVPLS